MSQYAQISDLFTMGLPATARGNLTDAQLNAMLIASSAKMDSAFNGRYAMPLLDWDVTTTQCCCHLTAYDVLVVRGYNPESGGDVAVKGRADDAIKWLDKVQRQQAHPNVTPQPTQTPAYQQPALASSSVVDLSTGRTAPNRGW